MTSTSGSFVRNSVYNLAGQALPLLIGLVTIPTLVHTLGLDRFGLLSLVWVFLGYMTFLDLGLSRAVIKLVAEDLAKSRFEEAPRTVWTASWIALGLSLIGSITLLLVSERLAEDLFKIPPHLHAEATGALQWIALSLPILTITAIFRGVLEAQQRFFSANILQGLSGCLTYLIPWVALFFTHSVETLIALITLGRALSLILHMFAAGRSIPLLYSSLRPHGLSARRLLDFGTWLTVSNLISPLMVYFDRFILSTLLPLANLAYYTTPYEVVSRVTILPSAISRVLFPVFSASHAVQSESGQTAKLLSRSLKMIGFFFLPICGALILLAPYGLRVWLGQDFAEKSTPILQIFAFGIFFNGLASVPFTFIQGANRPDLTAKAHLIELPLYFGGLWFLTWKFGLLGAASAWALRMFFDFVLLWVMAHKKSLNLPVRTKPLFLLTSIITVIFLMGINTLPIVLNLLVLLLSLFFLWTYLLDLDDRLLIMTREKKFFEPTTTSDKTVAVIITYQPDEKLEKTWNSIHPQFDDTLVIDNGSTGEARERLLQYERQGMRIQWNAENLGIAVALNQGFLWAQTCSAKWVASFDQDSEAPVDYRAKIFTCICQSESPELIAQAGPVVYEAKLSRHIRHRNTGSDAADVPMIITSGSFTRLQAYIEAEGFKNDLFIDYVDHDFSLRLRRRGYRVVQCPTTRLKHHVGSSRAHRFFVTFFSTHHNPLRRYYITRNRFYIYANFFWFEPDWVFQDFYQFMKELAKILLVETHKKEKLISVLQGFWDAARARHGKRGRFSL